MTPTHSKTMPRLWQPGAKQQQQRRQTMTDKQFYHAFLEARQYNDPDAFASDVALSDIFPAAEDDDLPALAEDLRHIWRYAHITVRENAKNE